MDLHVLTRIGDAMLARVRGPMKFRLVLQPCTAIFLAIRGGLQDAREGKPPYFWGLCTDCGEREAMLEDGWKKVSKVFIFAVVMDVIFQFIEQRSVRFLDAILVAIILAIVPYLLVRGPVNRLARHNRKATKERLAGD